MKKLIPAVLPLKSMDRLCVTGLKIDENLLWELVKFKLPRKDKDE